jgi:hypothetical protein
MSNIYIDNVVVNKGNGFGLSEHIISSICQFPKNNIPDFAIDITNDIRVLKSDYPKLYDIIGDTYELRGRPIIQLPGMTSNTLPSPLVASASSEYNSGTAAWTAFDKTTSDWGPSGAGGTNWIQQVYGKQYYIKDISLVSSSKGNDNDNCTLKFEGLNDTTGNSRSQIYFKSAGVLNNIPSNPFKIKFTVPVGPYYGLRLTLSGTPPSNSNWQRVQELNSFLIETDSHVPEGYFTLPGYNNDSQSEDYVWCMILE